MQKIILVLIMCIISSTAFADVGPLTAQIQQKIKDSGSMMLKYYDYTLSDIMGTSNKRSSSSVITYLTNDECVYRETKYIGKYKSYGHNAWLLKSEKVYSLNIGNKEGVLLTKKDENTNQDSFIVSTYLRL